MAIDSTPARTLGIALGHVTYLAFMSEQENKGKLNIELPEEVATGVYANLAVITHSPAEFVMDFIQVMPGMPKAKVRSRVVMSPHHVKRLLGALAENVQRFEKQHGPIQDHGAADPGMPLPYMGPQGQA